MCDVGDERSIQVVGELVEKGSSECCKNEACRSVISGVLLFSVRA